MTIPIHQLVWWNGRLFFLWLFWFLEWPQEWIDNSRNNHVVAVCVEGKLMEPPDRWNIHHDCLFGNIAGNRASSPASSRLVVSDESSRAYPVVPIHSSSKVYSVYPSYMYIFINPFPAPQKKSLGFSHLNLHHHHFVACRIWHASWWWRLPGIGDSFTKFSTCPQWIS